MTSDPTPTADASPGPITAEQWREAADRAFRRDRALLEDAYAAVELTDDIRKLFAAAIWRLDRDHILTLAALPARPAATSAAAVVTVALRDEETPRASTLGAGRDAAR